MATKTNEAPARYEVGRGKPPKHTRFKLGRSGNPGGRRKGSVNLKMILKSVLESGVELTENGRRRDVPLLEALVMKQVQEGLRGQLRAIESLLDRYERHVGSEEEHSEELPEEDLLLLERALGPRSRSANDSPDQRRKGADDD
jgi:hypothetical protein